MLPSSQWTKLLLLLSGRLQRLQPQLPSQPQKRLRHSHRRARPDQRQTRLCHQRLVQYCIRFGGYSGRCRGSSRRPEKRRYYSRNQWRINRRLHYLDQIRGSGFDPEGRGYCEAQSETGLWIRKMWDIMEKTRNVLRNYHLILYFMQQLNIVMNAPLIIFYSTFL